MWYSIPPTTEASMQSISRSFLLRVSLTVVALAAAMHLQIPNLAANPDHPCSNSRCYGPTMCIYAAGEICVISGPEGPCTTSKCRS
jgi:hypothetical protein